MDNAFSLLVHREHASISMTHTQLATDKIAINKDVQMLKGE